MRDIGADLFERQIVVCGRLERDRECRPPSMTSQRALVLDVVHDDIDPGCSRRTTSSAAGSTAQAIEGNAAMVIRPCLSLLRDASRSSARLKSRTALARHGGRVTAFGPLASGTGRAFEQPRADLALDAADRLAERGLGIPTVALPR